MKGPEGRSESDVQQTIQPDPLQSGHFISPGEKGQPIMPERNAGDSIIPSRRPGGPRTPAGKQRSKYNSTRHGIFSSVVVLKGESREDYDALLEGLMDSWQPVGAAEEILVEKMAMILWRHRRLVIAEGAETRKGQEFQESDRKQQHRSEAERQARERRGKEKEGEPIADLFLQTSEGLIWHPENPEILDRCLELLGELRKEFETFGFSSNTNESILKTIYGQRGRDHLRRTLYDEYGDWFGTSEVSEEEREREGYASPAACKKNVLQAIEAEIEQLMRSRNELLEREARHIELEKRRQSVPDAPALDRLLRYETTLDRSFDRTLSQLERLQRMRLGQPVPPPVKLEVSRN